jgi:hypothetical protein
VLAVPGLYWAGFAAWALFLFGYGTFSTGGGGPDFPHGDKLLHFAYYAAGAACVALARGVHRGRVAWADVAFAVGVLALAGAADEFYQSFFPHRSGNDPGDFAADVVGAAAGALAAAWALRVLTSHRPGGRVSPAAAGEVADEG